MKKQDYEIGDSCIFNNRIYIAKEGYTWTGVVAGTPPVVTTPAPNPPNDTDNWEVSEETAVRIWQKRDNYYRFQGIPAVANGREILPSKIF